jgi:hypothetical protein
MKKYINYFLFVSFIIVTIFTFNLSPQSVSATTVSNSQMTVSQFVELMITIGAVPADRVATVRAMITSLSKTSVATTTATSSLPYIQVLSPNGSESWEIDVDVPYTISWGSSSQIPVSISLIPARGAECKLTPAPITSKNTTNNYSIKLKTAQCYNTVTGTSTPVVDGSYKVRVSYVNAAGTTVKDESNANFTIRPIPIPSIKVTYPNGGENLVRNREYVAKYTLTNVTKSSDDLIYYYILDSFGNNVSNGRKLITSARTFDLDLSSSMTPGAYKVKIKLTTPDRVEIEDTSDNFFWVSSAN